MVLGLMVVKCWFFKSPGPLNLTGIFIIPTFNTLPPYPVLGPVNVHQTSKKNWDPQANLFLGGGVQIFLYVHPYLGEDFHFDEHMFQIPDAQCMIYLPTFTTKTTQFCR